MIETTFANAIIAMNTPAADRVRVGPAEAGLRFPFVVVRTENSIGNGYLDGSMDGEDVTLQVVVVGESFKQCSPVVEMIDIEINRYAGPLGPHVIDSCLRTQTSTTLIPESEATQRVAIVYAYTLKYRNGE